MGHLFSRILVPTDLSEASNAAIPMGASVAALSGASLDLLTVVDAIAYSYAGYPYANLLPELLAAADEQLQKLKLPAAAKKLKVYRQVLQGNVAESISDYATKYAVDLIVMSSHARSKLAKLFLGSVASKILHIAPCPVLLVRTIDGVTPASAKFKRILMPTDFSDRATIGLKRAAQVAEETNAELILLHVVNQDHLSLLHEKARKLAFKSLQEYSTEHLRNLASGMGLRKPVRHIVSIGDPAKKISDVASKEACDLVIIPSHGRGEFGQLVLGSVAANVVRQVTCPVMVERGK